jgi:multidrug efflux pump subunit AcrA (membrane-fusion protein)
VAVGDSLRVSIDALDQTVSGKLTELVPAADPMTRSFLVKVDIPSIKGLYPGMFGRLLVPVGTASVIWVPPIAVRRVGQLEMVTARIGDQWKSIYVTTGRTVGNRVEILSGLNGDETIAVTEGDE